jgi:RNA binding exosome subunit
LGWRSLSDIATEVLTTDLRPEVKTALMAAYAARQDAEQGHYGDAIRKLTKLDAKVSNPKVSEALRDLRRKLDDASYEGGAMPVGVWFEELAETIQDYM